MRKEVVLFLAVFLVVAGLGSAFVYDSNDIEKNYYLGEEIKGDFTISFNNETNGSVFTSNLNGSITLIEFLENNDMDEGFDFEYNESDNETINSGDLDLDLKEANILVLDDDVSEFILYLDGKEVFREDINVTRGFEFKISPGFILIGRETEFKIVSSGNISSSTWDFEDGPVLSSDSGRVRHTYTKIGGFDIEVEASNLNNETSKRTFTVIVGGAKDSAELTIKEYRNTIVNLTKKIDSFPAWVANEIRKEIDVDAFNVSLSIIEKDFNNASGDEDYVSVVNSLSNMNIPRDVLVTRSGLLPLDIGFNNIDVGYIESLSGKSSGDEEILKLAIIDWMEKNYNADADFEVVSSFDDFGAGDILVRYRVDVSKKNVDAGSGHLIIDYPLNGIVFLKGYGETGVDGRGTAVPISGDESIEFLIPQSIELDRLGMYISPGVSSFNIDTREICEGDDCPEGEFPWLWFILGLVGVLIVTLVLWILLQEWYKKNYEGHLFKNPDDLYNLINFIYNARSSGMKDGDIRKKLRKSKWGSERRRYAFRKIDGKRTGMWEIPLFKFRENRKVKSELARRHQGRVNPKYSGAVKKYPRF